MNLSLHCDCMKVLLVEDDNALAKGLSKALQREGFVVNAVAEGRQAIACRGTFAPDLVILDLGLPDIDGVSVLRQLRDRQRTLPILILTARDALTDKVAALDLGADDYLAKPFAMPELMARLRALARRLGTSASSTISLGTVTMDLGSREVSVKGEPVSLARREFMVLKALMENSGRVQTREVLEDKLYGWGEEVASNAIEVHISNLRKKLPPDFIKTIRGVGYTISANIAS